MVVGTGRTALRLPGSLLFPSPVRDTTITFLILGTVVAVLGPGGSRFGDHRKLGLPLIALFGFVAVLLVPVFWSF